MATFTSAAILSNSSTTNFNAWINEIYTGLVTNCGLRQLPAAMDSGQLAVPVSGVAVPAINTSAGYYMFSFTDPLAAGGVVTTGTIVGGASYTAGTYTNVALTGGSGSSAKATIVVSAGGAVTSVTLSTAGSGYFIGDQLSATAASIGGTGSGFAAYVSVLNSSAAPVVIKMEFGSGTATTTPGLWVTGGTSWTSSGTVGAATNGATTLRTNLVNAAPASVSTVYNSRFMYNNTLGACGLVFKETGGSGSGAYSFLYICRSNDTGGSPTSAGLIFLTSGNSTAQTSNGTTAVYNAMMSYTANTVKNPPLNTYNSVPASMPYGLTNTLENGTIFAFPIYFYTPAFGYSAFCAINASADIVVDNTVSLALVGSTPLTFISILPGPTSSGFSGITVGVPQMLILWQ